MHIETNIIKDLKISTFERINVPDILLILNKLL